MSQKRTALPGRLTAFLPQTGGSCQVSVNPISTVAAYLRSGYPSQYSTASAAYASTAAALGLSTGGVDLSSCAAPLYSISPTAVLTCRYGLNGAVGQAAWTSRRLCC